MDVDLIYSPGQTLRPNVLSTFGHMPSRDHVEPENAFQRRVASWPGSAGVGLYRRAADLGTTPRARSAKPGRQKFGANRTNV